jgi:hypothetical protein
MPERGVIRNREHKQQIMDFSGLCFGKITPTDIDAFMDFGDRLFVIVESKYGEPYLKTGQRLALERLVEACDKPPHRRAVAFVTSHTQSGDVDLSATKVVRYRFNGQWFCPKSESKTLLDGVLAFRRLVGLEVNL